jgi:Xaa-Pro aminopeptidase
MATTATKSAASSRRWADHLSARQEKLRSRLAAGKLDGLLITYPHDIRYLTGFCGEDAWALVSERELVILSDRRFEEELAATAQAAKVVIRKKPLADELGKLLGRRKLARLGVQADHLTLAQRKALRTKLNGARLRETSGWLLEQRAVKDSVEVNCLRRAVAVQEEALQRTLREVKPGMTEREVTGILEGYLWSCGGDGPGFNTIVAAGPNSSLPHYAPGEAKVAANKPLLIDWGGLAAGYHGDMTRVVFFGKPSSQFREIYQIVREAHAAGIAAVAPGVPLKKVDAAARSVIARAGYGRQFSHSLGHGIGLVIHEEPRLAKISKGKLEPGHVVTIEPGIYLPGVGGVRLEDDVLVTDTGCERLGSLPTELDWAIR